MTTALENYRICLNWLQTASRVVGLEFWGSRHRITPAQVLILVAMSTFFALTILTIYFSRGKALEMLQSLNFFFTAFTLAFKYFSFFPNRERIRRLTDRFEEKIYNIYKSSSSEYPLLVTYSRMLYITGHAITSLYIGGLFLFGTYPLVAYLREGRLELIFYIDIPFIDWTTKAGYWATFIMQLMLFAIGVCGMILVDYLCAFVSINGLLYVDIYIHHLDVFGKEIVHLVHKSMRPSGSQ
ncbi:AGAP009704-PA-like protein [Anopheles sinensis]|uniref:AGAP009704-PA-like protein n=1 Tax=Anopheles sinensis TaxID=74873 RepID=A0A084WU93_ANOSI|nr:AGAP009704-PA-like protein [Anopheles sinensis]